MAAKPTNTYAWNTGAANRAEPLAGKKVLGWVRGEKPASSFFNWLFNGFHTWINYLNDGAFEGDHSIDGDLAVTGDLTVDGTIEGGHPEREMNINAVEFEPDVVNTNPTLSQLGYRYNVSAVTKFIAPVRVLAGDVITRCTVYYNPNGGGGMQPKLGRINLATGVINYVWSGVNDNTGVAIETQTSGVIAHTVLAGEAYFIEVFHSAAANRTHGAQIKFSRPAP